MAWALGVVAACGGAERRQVPAGTAAAGPPHPADSLVLRTAGAEVWFTLVRQDADSAGRPCVERTLEIRREGRRIPVPLLYTGEIPVARDDSTIEAHLWLHCRAGDRYAVNLRTGQPVKVAR